MGAVARFLLSPVYRESRCLAWEVLVPMIQKAWASFPPLDVMEVGDAEGNRGLVEGDEQSQETLEEQLVLVEKRASKTQPTVSIKHLAMTIRDGQTQQLAFCSSIRQLPMLL